MWSALEFSSMNMYSSEMVSALKRNKSSNWHLGMEGKVKERWNNLEAADCPFSIASLASQYIPNTSFSCKLTNFKNVIGSHPCGTKPGS